MLDDGADEDLEFTLFNKREALVYQIPPASSSSGHKADDWKTCIWRGRCRIVGKGKDMTIKMIDASSGKLFAQCLIPNGEHTKYVDHVKDSSRYFVLKITNGERHAFIGLGFEERNDAFDFKSALSDFKEQFVNRDAEANAPSKIQGPGKDLSLKEGQKISLNLKGVVAGAKKRESQPSTGNSGGGIGLLAPPPPSGQSRRDAPTGGYSAPQAAPAPFPAFTPAPAAFTAAAPVAAASADDFFADFDDFQSAGPSPAAASPAAASPQSSDPFGGFEFTSAPAAAPASAPAAMSDFGAFAAAPAAVPSAAPVATPDFTAFTAAPPAAASTPAPAAAAPAAKGDFDPFTAAFGSAAAALPVQSSSAPVQKPPQKSDPFDDLDIFK
jgi:hypothetical protein